jgi:hypothetical protein
VAAGANIIQKQQLCRWDFGFALIDIVSLIASLQIVGSLSFHNSKYNWDLWRRSVKYLLADKQKDGLPLFKEAQEYIPS